MIDTMGIIIASNLNIPPLTDVRSASALPIAGGYRIIDFVLSDMANAGIQNIGVATQANYSSLMDHIKSGTPWDLNRKDRGLTLLPPNVANKNFYEIRGDLDILMGIREFLRRAPETYVVLSLGNNIYNIDFREVIKEHIDRQADITIIYKDMKNVDQSELSRFTLLDLDEEQGVKDIEVCPYYPKWTSASADVFVMEKALLESIVDECSSKGNHDFVKDAIAKKMSGLRVYGFEHKGYLDKIDSMIAYFDNNMKFLNEDMQKEMLHSNLPIYTKNKDLPPTKYGKEAKVENSYIADGCNIFGTVINSVLSGGVTVGEGAVVKNSVLMQGVTVGGNSQLEYVVLDKSVTVNENKTLIGQDSYPLPVAKGTVI